MDVINGEIEIDEITLPAFERLGISLKMLCKELRRITSQRWLKHRQLLEFDLKMSITSERHRLEMHQTIPSLLFQFMLSMPVFIYFMLIFVSLAGIVKLLLWNVRKSLKPTVCKWKWKMKVISLFSFFSE